MASDTAHISSSAPSLVLDRTRDEALEGVGEQQIAMGEYIEGSLAPDGGVIELLQPSVDNRKRTAFSFPILSALLHEFHAMSETNSGVTKTGRQRGRRPAAKVPCDECIARASTKKDEGASIELCEKCTAVLHRPRRKQEQPNVKRVRRQSNAIIDTALGVRTEPVDLPWSKDREEQHALQFFVQHSAPQLAGYFDSPFWQRMVLQAGRQEPAVRHAIAAIGALHEKLLTGSVIPAQPQDKRTRFALEQCNKSIQHLVQTPNASTSPDLRLMLTTCVLFTCFEALQGHCEQAIIHATQGYSLLQQYATDPENKRWDVGAFAVELDQLALLMRRLQTQSKGLMGKDFNVIPDPQAINANRPTEFNNLNEARTGLEMVLNQLTVFFLDMELDDMFYDLAVSNAEKHLLFSPWLAAWERAFSTYLAKSEKKLTPEDRKAAMILKAHELVAEILSEVDLSLGELGWDVFQHKFSAITNLAAAVLEDSKQADTSVIEARWKTSGVFISAPSATLSFSLGIVDPLYEVCARCRDPVLRRKALDLLARHPRQECVWSSWSAWKVGKFLMRMEEEGSETQVKTSADIPAESRISEAWFDFSDKSTEETQKGRVAYKKAVPRASARYALNPGLFEDWNTTEPAFIPYLKKKADRTGSDASSVPSLAGINTISAVESAWIDFNPSEVTTNLPSIQETPPQD